MSWSVLALALAAPIAAPTPAPSPSAAVAPAVPVREDGLVGTWYPPAGRARRPALLVLGGSEGGEAGGKRLAAAFAAQGYGVLALAYFKAPGLPPALQLIPLEYFDRALAWLGRQPAVDAKRIGLYGVSIGGETALLVASRRPELRAVVAVVPSSIVWQGFDPADYRSIASTYTLAGQPVPYVPYDTGAAFTGVYDMYARSFARAAAYPEAAIPVERTVGSILLLSAKADALWPSTAMSEAAMARLDAAKFQPAHRHVAYPDAGHGALAPADAAKPSDTAYNNLGGTPAGNAAARIAAWRETLAFFAATIGKPR